MWSRGPLTARGARPPRAAGPQELAVVISHDGLILHCIVLRKRVECACRNAAISREYNNCPDRDRESSPLQVRRHRRYQCYFCDTSLHPW